MLSLPLKEEQIRAAEILTLMRHEHEGAAELKVPFANAQVSLQALREQLFCGRCRGRVDASLGAGLTISFLRLCRQMRRWVHLSLLTGSPYPPRKGEEWVSLALSLFQSNCINLACQCRQHGPSTGQAPGCPHCESISWVASTRPGSRMGTVVGHMNITPR